MARKLKTYITSIGFYDLAIAAPSMKAALEAWGSNQNLFHQGQARETESAAVVAATMAQPGVVLRRPVGSKGAYKEKPDVPRELPVDAPLPVKRGKAKPKKASAAAAKGKDTAAILSFEKAKAKRDAARKKEEVQAAARQKKDNARIAQAIAKASDALERAKAMVLNTLRAWRLACPQWPRNLVFPTTKGTVHSNANLHHYCWGPLLRELDIVTQRGIDAEGQPILKPALTFHSLRHAAASLFIDQGWNAKKIQKVMGHSSIAVTFDVYGHLFKDTKSDLEDLAQMEARLLA